MDDRRGNPLQEYLPPIITCCSVAVQISLKHFLSRCSASVEQAGSVTFDGETIEGAPPLWCAAAAGICRLMALSNL